jgi:hypothetical protein
MIKLYSEPVFGDRNGKKRVFVLTRMGYSLDAHVSAQDNIEAHVP